MGAKEVSASGFVVASPERFLSVSTILGDDDSVLRAKGQSMDGYVGKLDGERSCHGSGRS